jgi:hypothetical protein
MRLKGRKMIIVMVEARLVVNRPPRQKGCLQEAGTEEFEVGNDIVLLHHIFFCKRRVEIVMLNHYSLNLFCACRSFFLFLLCPCSAL